MVQDATPTAFGPFCCKGVPDGMMLLEALAAQTAVALWEPRLRGNTGYILLYNQPLQFARQVWRSKPPKVNRVLREILLMLLQMKLKFYHFVCRVRITKWRTHSAGRQKQKKEESGSLARFGSIATFCASIYETQQPAPALPSTCAMVRSSDSTSNAIAHRLVLHSPSGSLAF